MPHHEKSEKGKNVQISKDRPHGAFLYKDNKLTSSKKERSIKEGLCTHCGGKHPIEKWCKRPQNRPGTSRGFPDNHENSSGINYSITNEFTTSVNSVSLVGELKTPSLPPSAHIPSIIPSQSLLPSRDEVFKQIQDVGEYVAISSRHHFQGHTDLPPLSFHASLDEWWEEEEELKDIETVLKLVHHPYNEYLDVFYKAKAEKLTPHLSCVHHIELEGLLPQACFIYSLSNNESETLRAYISENVEKGLIRPSSSSIGAPVLFVKKKDGSLCLCI
ncbi:hypothetical protein O181_066543 [Austropuccinia psidii MF-1]|uniref:Reverse transcriptase/retrotransposon-derived protein RNase H-like domain-containing protein n=1 Tax=Austropuccinia psidii MF-1 TaxID=1389203 RepID=A0A9Q3EXB1_9BASI|nr:hypothetical protein [Austropuccinia psidii MF-1]